MSFRTAKYGVGVELDLEELVREVDGEFIYEQSFGTLSWICLICETRRERGVLEFCYHEMLDIASQISGIRARWRPSSSRSRVMQMED